LVRVTVVYGAETVRCLLTAGGGASRVHEHSAVLIDDHCYVGVGDTLCALSIPHLRLEWHRKVDWATCFGVYFSPKHNCLLSHGELEISRIELDGRIVWQTGGRDIFSEGFRHDDDMIEVTDFYRTTYRISIATGKIESEFVAD
jgi:hypothetical protein